MNNNPLTPQAAYDAMREARAAYIVADDEDTAFAERYLFVRFTSPKTYKAWQAEIAATTVWLAFPWYERACVEWQAEKEAAA